ncbi:G1/S-specific cyclin-E1 isoform X2 [Scleropages formosus]|uniref:G1/S-specific cyclin-E1 isoform X2 n=1 Tax=Scleropages formosus TaxID=113540 RepID=UPI0008785963|nr:G1/S-specific cyclin-E1 isoform X2 [Scleropages formosus]
MPRKGTQTEPNTGLIQQVSRGTTRSRKRKADVAVYLQDPDEEIAEMTKKRQCESQACWDLATSSYQRISTPEHEVEEQVARDAALLRFAQYNFTDHCTPTRSSPLPVLCWANRDHVWNNLLQKDQSYIRDRRFMERHPNLQPKMRAILLDWMMEVCEVYKLHRETFYLAQDYFDRFMATQRNILKTTLQLIGISALFIAAKLEEIYPPKVHQFAYVTDGACTEDEILSMELIIMKELKWSLNPMTPVSWLNVYMQMAYLRATGEMLVPQFPQATFVQIAELLDVCVLDMGCLDFSYGMLAASALFHFSSLELVERVSGYQWADVEQCVKWMVPFAMSIRETGSAQLKLFKGISTDDMHNIQVHVQYLQLLERALSYQQMDVEQTQRSPAPSGVLTPPPSSEKPESSEP